MRFLYLLLFTVFIFGCGDPSDSSPATNAFREDVLKMSRAGLLKNVPQAKVDSLVKIYSKDSVNGLKELLVASGDLLKINVVRNGRKLEDVYQKICDTIGMKYPELKCDEVQTSILPDEAGGNDTGWVVVKVRFGQSWYERKLYYFRDWEIDDFIYRIYNRKLADDGKPQRLHLVGYQCVNCPKTENDFMGNTDVTRYGYIMLNKTQEDTLLTIPSLEMEAENEFAIYTTTQMNAELKKFEATGLIDEIGTKWYERTKNDMMQSSVYKQEDVYDFFDTLFSYTDFDTSNPYNPYEEILNSLAAVSRGKFVPSFVSDEEGNGHTRTVQFTYDGDIYKFDAEQHGAYLFPGIIDNVNKALADHKAGGAFYTVLTSETTCRLIYLDDDKAEKAKASGFFISLEKGPSREIKDRWNGALAL
jgi:hypothetical protein